MLRILGAAVLLAVAAAGCGAAARQPNAVHGVPRTLAQDWESRASAIATAASSGDSCRALRLAQALRTDVITKQGKVPLRLRAPLLVGVNSLADRITCTPVVTPQPPAPPEHSPPPPKGPKPPKHHGAPGHGKGHGEGHDK